VIPDTHEGTTMAEPSGTPRISDLPKYADLPLLEDIGARYSWGTFGLDDDYGTLNLLTPDVVKTALTTVNTGERIGLSLPLHQPDPPLFKREPFQHTITQYGNIFDDRLDSFYPQGSTQWDSFRHHRVRQHGFYGGVTDEPTAGKERLSIHHWGNQGIIGRGVLLDVARQEGYPDGYALDEHPISAEVIAETARKQGTTVHPGDILCIRTGWQASYRSLDRDGRVALSEAQSGVASIGLAADEGIAELLWDWHIAAIAADNPAVEVSPGYPTVGSLHRRVLGCLGIPLGELFDFEQLSARCAVRGRHDFLFVSVPLTLVGGLGSPGNAVAVL
jgi:kynurenine formamidase